MMQPRNEKEKGGVAFVLIKQAISALMDVSSTTVEFCY